MTIQMEERDRRISSKCLPRFGDTRDVLAGIAEMVLPPRRLSPSEAAHASLRNEKGRWDRSLVPMMLEPLDMLASRDYQGIIFVGPARSSKTYSMLLGGLCYIVTCSPGDTLMIQMSGDAARDMSRGDIGRALRESPDLQARISTRMRDDSLHTKHFRSGMFLKIGWPAISQLSSKTLQYVFITDYDRPENRDNVDGEGPIWNLAMKRIETYMSRGKCVAETSPGEALTDPNWRPQTEHEAPPVRGSLAIYNQGTRARWFWPCLECGEFTQAKPGLELFNLPPFEELEKLVKATNPADLAQQFAFITCKKCATVHKMEDRLKMNAKGRWLHEGETIIKGKITGKRRNSNIASYWLGGVAATYQRWDNLLQKYFQGVLTYSLTGQEETLKATTLTDQATPYLSRSLARHRGPEALLSRLESWEPGKVPPGVCFLTAAVDVQSYGFSVQVEGFGNGLQSWVIDRYKITTGKRMESADRSAVLDPASYIEDWNCIHEEVMKRTYPLIDHEEIKLEIVLTVCDSGGREGVTERAYDYWRMLNKMGRGRQFMLVKGDARLTIPTAAESWPDARGQTKRGMFARGDVPVWLLNVNLIKDGLASDLGREKPGPGYCHFATWLDKDFFNELTAETRAIDGWKKKNNAARNEALDLKVYNRGGCQMLKAHLINWDDPPVWALDPLKRIRPTSGEPVKQDTIAELARALNG